jgi:hypothetical protein
VTANKALMLWVLWISIFCWPASDSPRARRPRSTILYSAYINEGRIKDSIFRRTFNFQISNKIGVRRFFRWTTFGIPTSLVLLLVQ